MSNGLGHQTQNDVHGVYLLFRDGNRPTSRDVRKYVAQSPGISISFDPAEKPDLRLVGSDDSPDNSIADGAPISADSWLELLSEGLTFDVTGLAPGPQSILPDVEHCFDFEKSWSNGQFQSVNVRPGAHILEAAGTLPVLKGLLRIARDLIQHFEQIEAVVWPHSESVIGRRFFESTISAYLEGGVFPALGLIAFHETVDGGLQSVGLAHVIGQELRVEPELSSDKLLATRLAVRLINQLVLSGSVDHVEEVIAPDGRLIRLEPSNNERYVRVRSG